MSQALQMALDDVGSLLSGKGPLVIFLHGNRYDAWSAKQQGIRLAKRCRFSCPIRWTHS